VSLKEYQERSVLLQFLIPTVLPGGDGTWRSVYDKLSQAASALKSKSMWRASTYDRQLYGNLLFYDATAVSDKDLSSPEFLLCKEAPARIASWRFRLEAGKMETSGGLYSTTRRIRFCSE